MKHNKYIIFILAAAITLGSCKKQLDLQPTDTVSENNAFLTLEDIQFGVNGAYNRLGNAYADNMYVNALMSDEARLGAGNSGQGALTYKYQFSADGTTGGDVIAAFSDYYELVDHINRVLGHIPTVTITADQEGRKNILKGQLLALRGVANFELMQAYSKNYDPADPRGIAIMLAPDPLVKPARNSMGEVMTQIESDFSEAKTILAGEVFSDTVMNKYNIAAYQARIALYKKDYDAAITFASEVINSGFAPLVTTASDFNGIWIDLNSKETLLRYHYATSTLIGGLWTTTQGQSYVAPSDKLVASLGNADLRKAAFIGTFTSGSHYVNKFYASPRGGRVLDAKIARTAEMYLIRAEANAKKSSPDVAAGASDLNTLRGVRISGYVPQTFATASDLFDAVINERFKELCFEGFRYFDLKRAGLPVQRLLSDANIEWSVLAAGDYRFVLPIPRDELNANPNMVQNDGY